MQAGMLSLVMPRAEFSKLDRQHKMAACLLSKAAMQAIATQAALTRRRCRAAMVLVRLGN